MRRRTPVVPRPPDRPPLARPLEQFPNVYDAAFSWDRSSEARTYLRIAASERGRPVESALELACGTGAIARAWSGSIGAVYGLDRDPVAIARARWLGRPSVPADHWRLGELRGFRWSRPVDLAAVPLDGLGNLVDRAELLGFFRSAKRALRPGGILAVDLTLHPPTGVPLPVRNDWRVALRPAGTLEVSYRSEGRPWGDPPRQWEVARFRVRVPGGVRQRFWSAHPQAALSARALAEIAQTAGGFEPMRVYSGAAHRSPGSSLRRLRSGERATGPHLVTWLRP